MLSTKEKRSVGRPRIGTGRAVAATVYIPVELLDAIQDVVKRGGYPSRSALLVDLLVDHMKQAGVLTEDDAKQYKR